MSSSAAMHVALSIAYLKEQGLASLEEIKSKFASKKRTAGCASRTSGGVRGVRSNAAPISILVIRVSRLDRLARDTAAQKQIVEKTHTHRKQLR